MCVCIYRKLVSVFDFSDIFSIFLIFFSLLQFLRLLENAKKIHCISLRLLALYKTLTFNAEKGWGRVVGWKNINTRNCLFVCLFEIQHSARIHKRRNLLLESMWGQ